MKIMIFNKKFIIAVSTVVFILAIVFFPVSATAPDPDKCGTTPVAVMDGSYCSGTSPGTPAVRVAWPVAPDRIQTFYTLRYYVLTINGVGSWNTGLNTSYNYVGLTSGIIYNWSVEAYYTYEGYNPPTLTFKSADFGMTGQPNGAFKATVCCSYSNGGLTYYRINPWEANKIIMEHGVCKKVSNNSANSYFIPTKTGAGGNEWGRFISSPPPGITFAECCP